MLGAAFMTRRGHMDLCRGRVEKRFIKEVLLQAPHCFSASVGACILCTCFSGRTLRKMLLRKKKIIIIIYLARAFSLATAHKYTEPPVTAQVPCALPRITA